MTDLTVEDIEWATKHWDNMFGEIEMSLLRQSKPLADLKRFEKIMLAARQALAAREDGGWKPISSVPKNETVLLLEDCATYAGWWDSAGEYFKSACGQPVVYTPEPTHWRPLPPPPNQQTEGEET